MAETNFEMNVESFFFIISPLPLTLHSRMAFAGYFYWMSKTSDGRAWTILQFSLRVSGFWVDEAHFTYTQFTIMCGCAEYGMWTLELDIIIDVAWVSATEEEENGK